MIKYSDAQIAFAQAIYDLLSNSDVDEWFTVEEIRKHSAVNVGGAFIRRVLILSEEENEVFNSINEFEQWTLGKEGFELVEATRNRIIEGAEDLAPASDRVVQFNHNAPDAQEILAKLEDIKEAVRGVNGPEVDEQERSRVFDALSVARDIWHSGHFKLIQLKVGVLLAVEDASALLSKTAKHVAAAVLVDTIKAFVKNHFHVDMDAI